MHVLHLIDLQIQECLLVTKFVFLKTSAEVDFEVRNLQSSFTKQRLTHCRCVLALWLEQWPKEVRSCSHRACILVSVDPDNKQGNQSLMESETSIHAEKRIKASSEDIEFRL